ncbi:hypothetical protein Daus18300_009200 [Diaporthe australafricana]|uniref:Uncharacterized protein n=1 Tax=Diaporthe australafricana TaxID=127596 RepID=A0ABR3WF97_9PEZI
MVNCQSRQASLAAPYHVGLTLVHFEPILRLFPSSRSTSPRFSGHIAGAFIATILLRPAARTKTTGNDELDREGAPTMPSPSNEHTNSDAPFPGYDSTHSRDGTIEIPEGRFKRIFPQGVNHAMKPHIATTHPLTVVARAAIDSIEDLELKKLALDYGRVADAADSCATCALHSTSQISFRLCIWVIGTLTP